MMEEQTTSPRQEDLKSKQKLTFQNRILSLGKATEIYSQNGAASLEEFAPVMEVLSSNRRRAFAVASKTKKQTLSFSQQRRLAGRKKLLIFAAVAVVAILAYCFVGVNFSNPRLFNFAMKIRTPKVLAMIIAAVAVGGSSIVFQSIVNNTIVTPCLLGMNSLYTLIHTATVFVAGSASFLATNANLSFGVDLVLMAVVATTLYSYLFKKTGHNVLYVLLIGTVLTSFFGSIQSTMIRVMDPNEYDALLASLVASFSNVNGEIILFSVVVLAAVAFFLRKELALL
ncbi:MAG: iron chelate uptake ABC transporter family permease subunit, partial [Spirochaetaceae bacterium]|nr:iron chelate uptake ABC transporter family permease subunit [Spirochaetaceae bacterium]